VGLVLTVLNVKFGWMFGFLAVPITGVVKILLQRFGYTRAIADLIAGKTDMLTKSPPDK
jgi:hypothetical protein